MPDELKFIGPDSGFNAGFLHLCSIPVSFLLRRPYFGRSYDLDRHSSFLMTFENWQELYARSGEAILWVDRNLSVVEGWFPALYSLMVCALIQVSLASCGTNPNGSVLALMHTTLSHSIILSFAGESFVASRRCSWRWMSSSALLLRNALSDPGWQNWRLCYTTLPHQSTLGRILASR